MFKVERKVGAKAVKCDFSIDFFKAIRDFGFINFECVMTNSVSFTLNNKLEIKEGQYLVKEGSGCRVLDKADFKKLYSEVELKTRDMTSEEKDQFIDDYKKNNLEETRRLMGVKSSW